MSLSYARLLARRVYRSLWFTPAAYAVLAVLALLLAPALGVLLPNEFHKLIGLDGVDDLLGVLANTLLAVAIFSLGIMVSSLQAAASAATPRARPLLMQDRTAQNAISVFIGGFIYAIVGTVGLSTSYFGQPSRVILFLTTCLVIVSVIYALIRWIARLSNLGDVSEVIDLLEDAAEKAFADLAARPLLGGVELVAMPDGGVPLYSERFGFVQAIDDQLFAALCAEQDLDVWLAVRPGTYVDSSTILLRTSRALDEDTAQSVRRAFVIAGDRTFEADPRFGLIVLSETASKALSPGVNDPGTAIDVLGTSLRILAGWSTAARATPARVTCPRLHVPPIAIEDLVCDAFRWIARDGAGQLEVQIRLQKALRSLAAHDPVHFGEAARGMSHEAFARAKIGLALPGDVEILERFVLD
ncbi:putative membrane protein [Blastomonas natatoria]|uniref:Putative membrane protein n=1 Tax=Blastomonas natatoria TaxID=34015 RepID=A0A2V3UWL7_9SPHN|nr:DUF2254 domain-containing protein [Blastomonas natatoria]PXW73803.1 putative membrane protein [Blastomonas natatoria]